MFQPLHAMLPMTKLLPLPAQLVSQGTIDSQSSSKAARAVPATQLPPPDLQSCIPHVQI
jgi:hypothetical protein